MATFSKTIMIGRLTADPEIRTTTSGKTVCNFTLAVDRRFDREKADFFQAVAWSKTAEFIAQYFHKGDQLLVCGPLQTHSFDAQDGRKITVTEIFVEEAQFVDRQKPREESEQKHEPIIPGLGETRVRAKFTAPQATQDFEKLTDDENLPF